MTQVLLFPFPTTVYPTERTVSRDIYSGAFLPAHVSPLPSFSWGLDPARFSRLPLGAAGRAEKTRISPEVGPGPLRSAQPDSPQDFRFRDAQARG